MERDEIAVRLLAGILPSTQDRPAMDAALVARAIRLTDTLIQTLKESTDPKPKDSGISSYKRH